MLIKKSSPYNISEFLNVTVTQSCDHAKFSWLCAKSWDLYAQTKKLCLWTYFTVFSSWFTFTMWFLVWFLHFFLRKNFKSKVLTAQKNKLLECLQHFDVPDSILMLHISYWYSGHNIDAPDSRLLLQTPKCCFRHNYSALHINVIHQTA